MPTTDARATAPVRSTPLDDERRERPTDGLALCLSGGGYRAMLFHVGVLWRLNDVGYLSKVERVSSVSGGSITAAVLGLNWEALGFETIGAPAAPVTVGANFVDCVVEPLRAMASVTIDKWAIGVGVITPGISISDRVVDLYRKYLFKAKTLQDLPDRPRFVINATNVQSGALWRFSKPYMADWRVGRVPSPTTELAVAVAASSAFPPVLSPAHLSLEPGEVQPNPGNNKAADDLHRPPYTTEVVLTDGGVYDNLGLETAWKNYTTVLVSDAGGKIAPDPDPPGDWARHSKRVLDLIDNQVRSLRKRQLIDSYQLRKDHENHRDGAYWGIRTAVADYNLPVIPNYPFTPATCPAEKTIKLAEIATRLKALDDTTQERLINWGYAVTDVALRKHVDATLPAPTGFPYSDAGIG